MDTAIQVLLLAFALVGPVAGSEAFSLTDCEGNKETELLHFTSPHVSPYPVGIPGDLHVSGSLTLNREVSGDVAVHLSIERYVGFFWVTIPCIGGIGSCTYPSMCALLSTAFAQTGCPAQVSSINLPCQCPVPAGTYAMTDGVFQIPELSGLLSWLSEGDYRVTAKLIDSNNNQVACQQLKGTIVDGHPPCSGFLCSIFG